MSEDESNDIFDRSYLKTIEQQADAALLASDETVEVFIEPIVTFRDRTHARLVSGNIRDALGKQNPISCLSEDDLWDLKELAWELSEIVGLASVVLEYQRLQAISELVEGTKRLPEKDTNTADTAWQLTRLGTSQGLSSDRTLRLWSEATQVLQDKQSALLGQDERFLFLREELSKSLARNSDLMNEYLKEDFGLYHQHSRLDPSALAEHTRSHSLVPKKDFFSEMQRRVDSRNDWKSATLNAHRDSELVTEEEKQKMREDRQLSLAVDEWLLTEVIGMIDRLSHCEDA